MAGVVAPVAIFSVGLMVGFLWGFFAAHSAGTRGPLAYLAALKVILWDYSNVTMVLQVWSDIPVYTTVAAAPAFLGSNVVRTAFPQWCTKPRCVLPAVDM